MIDFKYNSQFKQDMFVDKYILNKLENGFFVEIGAYDGISLSNTYAFEKFRNWKGICVEPITSIFAKLEKNRKCECIHGCIFSNEGEIEITHVDGPSEMLTGISDKYNDLHKQRIEKEVKELGGEIKKYKVPTYNLTNLLSKRNIKHVNFCSIDVEGSEWEVLQSIDFSKITFDAFSIENNYKDDRISDFMLKNAYVCVGTLDADQIFVSKSRSDINSLKSACKILNLKMKAFSKLTTIFK
jgi:FkbM family methyltransferase